MNRKQHSPNSDSDDELRSHSSVSSKSPAGTKTSTQRGLQPATSANDRQFLLVTGSLFFVIMVWQYAWKAMDTPEPLTWKNGPATDAFKLDINTATWAEWAQLADIGPELAMQIVADRDENGEFRSIDDVGRVAGIGASTLDGIRPLLTIAKSPVKTLRPDGQSIEPAENQ